MYNGGNKFLFQIEGVAAARGPWEEAEIVEVEWNTEQS